ELRQQTWEIVAAGYPGGRFAFNGFYTRASNSAATGDRAQSFAQFLLGLPTSATGAVATPGTASSQFEIASPGEGTQTMHAFFLQDDWQVNPRLTLNAGLRFEVNGGLSEAQNRNLAGFDTTTPNPLNDPVRAAEAAQPTPARAPA